MLKKGNLARTRNNRPKTFRVYWGDRCIGETGGTSKPLVRKHFWDLFRERIAEDHPDLLFQDERRIRVEEVAEDGDAEEKDAA